MGIFLVILVTFDQFCEQQSDEKCIKIALLTPQRLFGAGFLGHLGVGRCLWHQYERNKFLQKWPKLKNGTKNDAAYWIHQWTQNLGFQHQNLSRISKVTHKRCKKHPQERPEHVLAIKWTFSGVVSQKSKNQKVQHWPKWHRWTKNEHFFRIFQNREKWSKNVQKRYRDLSKRVSEVFYALGGVTCTLYWRLIFWVPQYTFHQWAKKISVRDRKSSKQTVVAEKYHATVKKFWKLG